MPDNGRRAKCIIEAESSTHPNNWEVRFEQNGKFFSKSELNKLEFKKHVDEGYWKLVYDEAELVEKIPIRNRLEEIE